MDGDGDGDGATSDDPAAVPANLAPLDPSDPREHLPCGLATLSGEGRVLYANALVRGWAERDPRGEPFVRLLTRPSHVYYESQVLIALHVTGKVESLSMRMRGPDGPVPVFTSGTRDAASGTIELVLYPAGERFGFERELIRRRREAEALGSVMLASPDPIYSVDAQLRVASWNPAAEDMLGYSAEEALGHDLAALLAPDRVGETQRLYDITIGSDRPVVVETELVAKSGESIPVEANTTAIRDETGGPTGAVGVVRDIRARRRTQAQLDALAEEVAHRSKNMLSVVQVIARQTRRRSSGSFEETFERRLDNLVHNNALLVTHKFEPVDARKLIESQIAHLGLADGRFRLDGPPLAVRSKAAEAISMALFELATNAAKYGPLQTPEGGVAVTWGTEGGVDAERFILDWHETGGPPVEEPSQTGFGSILTGRVLEAAVQGTVERSYAPEGLRWRLDAPRDAVVSP